MVLRLKWFLNNIETLVLRGLYNQRSTGKILIGNCLFMIGLVLTGCGPRLRTADEARGTKPYDYTWESLETHPVPEWFSDAKFGIFVVWGPYSIPAWRPGNSGYTEWFPCYLYANPETYYPWMRERFGAAPPELGYKDICRRFEGKNFDPDKWAVLFRQSGAKYVIQIAEFHGGFAMWDSRYPCSSSGPPCTTMTGSPTPIAMRRT